MKHFTINDGIKKVNFKAYDENRARRKAERIAKENKMFGYELNKRKF